MSFALSVWVTKKSKKIWIVLAKKSSPLEGKKQYSLGYKVNEIFRILFGRKKDFCDGFGKA